jgi:hypothetical protein
MTMTAQNTQHTAHDELIIRVAEADDAEAIARLAQLEGRRAPSGRLLVAEVGGEVQAAIELHGGSALADPFKRTDWLVELLHVRRDQRDGSHLRQRSRHNRRHGTPAIAHG